MDNKHNLYLRVTDNAGNTKDYVLKHEEGCDMDAPHITDVEIKKVEKDSVKDYILNFLSFGTFYKDEVEIIVTADDNGDSEDGFKSGIDTVTLNGRTMIERSTGEYVLTVSPDDILEQMKVKVVDKAGWSAEGEVTKLQKQDGNIISNDLIVEDDLPDIEIDPKFQSKTDNKGNIWLGSENASDIISIKAEDKGNIRSGLAKVTVYDNGISIEEKSDFTSIEQKYEKDYKISDFGEGVHNIVVTAVDHAGNTFSRTLDTFYIDTGAPENKGMTIIDPEGKKIGKEQWFDKNDVITFRADSADEGSGIRCMEITVNGQGFKFESENI